jgi:hypothetical protein
VFWALFGALVAGQIAVWACYGHLRSSADVLSVAEGSMYALAFFVAGVAAAVFGQRTSSIALSVPLLGLSSRKLLNRKIMLQTVICAAAFASRALASLGAAIAAATGVDDRWSVSCSHPPRTQPGTASRGKRSHHDWGSCTVVVAPAP